MSFAKIFKAQIDSFTEVAKKLDARMKNFAHQLAKRLDVDENKMLIEFEACLKYFELEESKEMEKSLEKEKKKMELEEEKEKRRRERDEEKAQKALQREIEKQKKDEERAQKLREKEEEKAQKLLQKMQEKELAKKQKDEEKERAKLIKQTAKKESASKLDETYDFESEPIKLSNNFWKSVTPKTIQGLKVDLHKETGLILTKDEHPVLFGIKIDKGVITEDKMLDKYLSAKTWAKNCGIIVPSLQDEDEEEVVIIEDEVEENDDLELTE